jgi:hypothetical protein
MARMVTSESLSRISEGNLELKASCTARRAAFASP